MKQGCRLLCSVSALLLCVGVASQPATAAEVVIDRADGDEPGPSSFFLPLLFYTETSDTALGLTPCHSDLMKSLRKSSIIECTTIIRYFYLKQCDTISPALVEGRKIQKEQ